MINETVKEITEIMSHVRIGTKKINPHKLLPVYLIELKYTGFFWNRKQSSPYENKTLQQGMDSIQLSRCLKISVF